MAYTAAKDGEKTNPKYKRGEMCYEKLHGSSNYTINQTNETTYLMSGWRILYSNAS